LGQPFLNHLKLQTAKAENKKYGTIVQISTLLETAYLHSEVQNKTMCIQTCFLIVLSKIKGALSLVKMVTNGSLLANTNSAISDLEKLPSAE